MTPQNRLAAAFCPAMAVLFAAWVVPVSAPLATAADAHQKVKFDIPAAPALETLKQFAAQSGVQLLYEVDLVKGSRTQAVNGSLTPRDAINQMLAGTELVAAQTPNGAIAVSRANGPNGERAERATAGDRPGSEQTKANEIPLKMSVFEVNEPADQGYRSTQTTSSTKTVETLRNTPVSISVLNRELMDDLNVTSIAELSMYAVTGETSFVPDSARADFVFRGIISNASRVNGALWYTPVDSYNIDRAELLRGPSAFLYGDGVATGMMNQVTKQAQFQNFARGRITVGSYGLHRGEIDLNRRLRPDFSARLNLVYQKADSFIHHAKRNLKGVALAFGYKPWADTKISLSGEAGRLAETRPDALLVEQYSTTRLNGATTAYTDTTGGLTYLAANGRFFDTVGRRYSSGLGVNIVDPGILPRDANFLGPNSYHNVNYSTAGLTVDQRVSSKLNFQLTAMWQEVYRYTKTNTGSLSAGVYLDTNPTLPDGTANPYLNQLYTEYSVSRTWNPFTVIDARLTGIYDWELPFMKQRVMAMGIITDSDPLAPSVREYVDPGSSSFKGTLINADTLAAHTANVATLNRNLFFRRFYLKDGDRADLTANEPIPGRSVINPDPGGNAGLLVKRLYRTPGYGIGSSGSYFKDRFRTLVGWRKDYFLRSPERQFWNPVTQTGYKLPQSAQAKDDVAKDSRTLGGVLHLGKFASLYVNRANSIDSSSAAGAASFIAGTTRGLTYGDGYEYGLRWSFLDGRVETNWTYYISNQRKVAAPAPSAAARNEFANLFRNFDLNGADTQSTKASGLELETVTNLTPNWRLMWNLATNELDTAERVPVLRAFAAEAKKMNAVTPAMDQYLASVPDGTPVGGYTKIRSNLVTRYQFRDGPLKNLSVGGGFQYRDKTYAGNADVDRNGVAEEIWWRAYTLLNVSAGYQFTVSKRRMSFNLTVNNLLNKEYLRSNALAGGTWGSPRIIRLAWQTNL